MKMLTSANKSFLFYLDASKKWAFFSIPFFFEFALGLLGEIVWPFD